MSERRPTAEERRWVEQWRVTGPELARIRRQELRALTDARALVAANRLLSLVGVVYRNPARRTHSGLVEQQALLHRRALK
jgi:hypothetical protein